MISKNMEQAEGLKFDLQFHAEPDPGAGNPPTNDVTNNVNNNIGTDVGTDQVDNQPSGDVQQQNTGSQIPPEIANSKWYKDAIRGMNEAQRIAAQFKPFIEQNLTADQLQRAVQIMQQLESNPHAFYQQLEQYLTSQQQQQMQEPENEWENEPWFQAAVAAAEKRIKAQIAPLKQFYSQQQREMIQNQAKAKFSEVASYTPGLNIDNPTDPFWQTMDDLGLPPTHADWGAVITKYNSVKGFIDALKPQIIAEYQEEIKKKSNVSSTLKGTGAQQAVQSKSLDEMSVDELFNGWAEIQAAKAARLGQL